VSGRSRPHRIADCLEDILDNITRIEGYTADLERNALEQDGLRRDAVERWRCRETVDR
jgi:uncharacterized protein with HEPN domain